MKKQFRRGQWYVFDPPNPFRVFASEELADEFIKGDEPEPKQSWEPVDIGYDFGKFEEEGE